MTGGRDGGRALPAGDVCFLFTDIEASTELLRAVGDAQWVELLLRSRGVLAAAIDEHGGVVVNVDGDGCFAAFAGAAEAAAACAEAQQVLRDTDWGEQRELRVRMGLHAGTGIIPRDGDYVALAVHRAARVCAAASGGQTLATSSVAAQAPGMFSDLGLYSVRDFDGAVRLYALATPDAGATRPPRVPPAFDAQVPRYDTALVGRDEEITQILATLARHPVTTLVGAEGAGKTRLAVAVLSERSPDIAGAWFVDLTAVPDPGHVGDVLARAVGCPPDVDVDAHLDAVLDGRAGLLVLDHCDQLRPQAAAVAALLRNWNPTLRVLCTAREPIGVAHESVFEVGPLEAPSSADPAAVLASGAGRLFLERAQRTLSDPELPHSIAPEVVRICRATAGNALGLEVTAALCADEPLPDVVTAVEQAGSSTAGLVDVALHRLAGDRRLALAALAVPAQPVPHLLAMAAVAATGAIDARRSIEELLRRSLLAAAGEDAYRLLPTVRDRAAGQLTDDMRVSVLLALLQGCLSATAEPPVPVTMHDAVAPVAAALLHESSLPGADRQRLTAQLGPWWSGRLGGRRARELLGEALALGRLGSATAALHLAIAHTFGPGTETVETERHVHEAARLLGEVDAVPATLVERLRRAVTGDPAPEARPAPQPGTTS